MNSMKPEIIVGIPSYNEAGTIAEVTRIIDEGLKKYFPTKKGLIVNADNNSPDNTKQAFLSAKTKTQKHYLSTRRGITGKGNNLRNLFKFFLGKGASKLMIIDADISSAEPYWVRNLLTPLSNGFEHCFPVYPRAKYDGSITNHFCYPIVKGVLGVNIRQPIGGEMSFSREAVQAICKKKWPVGAYRFGIDILMTTSSIFSKLKLGQVWLGAKRHNPSEPKLFNMFEEVASTLFKSLDNNKHFWHQKIQLKNPKIMFKKRRDPKPFSVSINHTSLKKTAVREFERCRSGIQMVIGSKFTDIEKIFQQRGKFSLGTEDWIEIVFQFIKAHKIDPVSRAKLLRPLYFAHFLTFYRMLKNKDSKYAERAIISQANLFYKTRNILFL